MRGLLDIDEQGFMLNGRLDPIMTGAAILGNQGNIGQGLLQGLQLSQQRRRQNQIGELRKFQLAEAKRAAEQNRLKNIAAASKQKREEEARAALIKQYPEHAAAINADTLGFVKARAKSLFSKPTEWQSILKMHKGDVAAALKYQEDRNARLARAGKAETNVSVNTKLPGNVPVPEYSKLPKGFVYVRNPDNSIKLDEKGVPVVAPVRGGAEDVKRKELEQKKQEKQKVQSVYGNVVMEDINRAINLIKKGGKRLPVTGFGSETASQISGTEAHQLAQYIKTIKANAGFDKLQKMRDSSPTGGALGQVSERELSYLQSAIGSLDQSQDAKELMYNLQRVRNIYDQIIHGPKSKRKKPVKKLSDEELLKKYAQ